MIDKANNFRMLHTSFYNKTIEFNSLLSALKSIKLAGANCSRRSEAQVEQSSINQLLKRRQTLEQPFSLTYKICFFIADKEGSIL